MTDGYYPDEVQYREGHYYVELPGGWCVPADQMPDWPFNRPIHPMHPGLRTLMEEPITARRGGIKYPKGTPVTKSLEQQLVDLKRQHKATHENLSYLAERIAELDKKVKARRSPPPGDQNAWTIDVRFERDGKLYHYLILRTNGMYYTTGVQDSYFRTWAGLLEWLDSTAGHGALLPLQVDYEKAAPLEGRRD